MAAHDIIMAAAGASGPATYIEDVFSTYLYTGTGNATQTITNGIDLAGKGGLVWIKSRTVTGADNHYLQDTARGIRNVLSSNLNIAQQVNGDVVTAVYSNGYLDNVGWATSDKIASWTFRKQPKFFDVVTFSHTFGVNETISHSLGSTPGCIFVKMTDGVDSWVVYHRSTGTGKYLRLNSTAAVTTNADVFQSVTSTTFQFSPYSNTGTYVAYLFAHDAGGFGLTGTDNVISCGSFTTDGSGNATVNLGYEPQWLLWKRTDAADGWGMVDCCRTRRPIIACKFFFC